MNDIGLTRFCEWDKTLGACDIGWGSINSSGMKTCYDGSAKENCCNIVHVPLKSLDAISVRRLRELGDITTK